MKYIGYIFLVLWSATGVWGQPLSPRTASYDMQLSLDTEQHRVEARQTLTFTNPSADTIWTMPFHMYYNAFKNNKTTFLTGALGVPISKPQEAIDNGEWAWITVKKVVDGQGNDLTAAMRYIQPDDGNPDDHTVLEVRLEEPILPYASYRLEMEWASQVPQLMIRTGYSRDFYFMAQWYPKLGVYEAAGTRFAKEGQWNCHQYHRNTEYYGEFGTYRVSMTLPSQFVVGASGVLVDTKTSDGQNTYTYLAEDVIDFTWAASPHFVEVRDKWADTDIRLLIMPEHLHQQRRFLEPAKQALDFYADYLEPYPYSTLTIVSPPYYGLMAGAMEYPTLFTSPTLSFLPQGIRTTETLTLHELTHQYFMQMLATNEQEEPWMDEGFTSFFEAKLLDRFYPAGVVAWDRMGLHISSRELRRGRFFSAENIKAGPLSAMGYQFEDGSYRSIIYGKPAVGLASLEGMVGEEVMQEIMQTYFHRWKFKHPGRQDFIDIVNEVVPKYHRERLGDDMNWFLEPMIFGTEVCDYAVSGLSHTKIEEPLGFFENTERAKLPTDLAKDSLIASVVVSRLGEMVVPQEIRIVFDDGAELLEYWDGKARSHTFSYRGIRRIVCAEVDPAGKIPLDINQLNNSYTEEQPKPGLLRTCMSLLSWLQGMMVSISLIV